MEYRLIYEDTDGQCKIIVPDTHFRQPSESDEASIGRIYALAIPGVVEFIVCTPEKIPGDLVFREAWTKGDSHEPIKVDFDKAMAIHRRRLEEAAENKIEKLDKELDIALENDNLPAQVAIRRTKKILRTIHETNLTHCKKVEDIKWSIPKELYDVWVYYDPSNGIL